ncbi:DUF1963 domain-containing protein [Actinoplanes sp. L3-i22]|uniref:DUF1963 domain-containing protein n=1 Tax=Actinoplanes sp. L3-i22 TaxID=2836373 RepID=UPI001C782759|nr:DUF1963 domain-containing protein [Actinoplanes sp. L3-i22]BCY08637.1 hypothetical protein L3i22_037250 [Actinoplanes sp. L3-i22]
MTSRNQTILDQIRAEALDRGIPADDVDRWMGLVRPCALLDDGGDGPVVGRFGGPVLLPPDVEDPAYPLIATIDCAALPPDVTDLPLPADGRLLFFGYPEENGMGNVVYIPAGAAVTERSRFPQWLPPDKPENAAIYKELPDGEMHLTADISLPFVGTVDLPGPPWAESLPGHPHSEALAEVWEDQWGGALLLFGGYGTDYNGSDPLDIAAKLAVEQVKAGPTAPRADNWVLLAEASVDRPGAGATIYWTIQRDDLIALRFDRAQVLVYWNP